MKYKCYYEGKDFFHTEIIDASTPEDAAKSFENPNAGKKYRSRELR